MIPTQNKLTIDLEIEVEERIEKKAIFPMDTMSYTGRQVTEPDHQVSIMADKYQHSSIMTNATEIRIESQLIDQILDTTYKRATTPAVVKKR